MDELRKIETLTEAAGLATTPLSAESYRSAAFYDLERERIFRRAWLVMGRVEAIPQPGDYFVKTIEVLDASLILTRTKDGAIRGFHNVCSHRQNQLVPGETGNANRFVCRYHSWTYRNDGELIAVPDEARFFDLDKKKCGLTPVAVEVWEGWIFANLTPEPEVSLAEFLGDFGTSHRDLPYPNPERALVLTGEFQANWKTVADAFSEAYHIRTIHAKTLAPVYTGAANPYGRPISAEVYGPHRSLSTWVNPEFAPPERALVEKWLYPQARTVTGTGKTEETNRVAMHPAVNPTKSPEWASDVKWLFPNFHIHVSATMFWTHQFWPTGPRTARWEGRFYMPVARTARERLQQEHYVSHMTDIMLEDVMNIESTQRGMNSGAKDLLHIQDGEIMVRHSLQQVERWAKAATVREALAP